MLDIVSTGGKVRFCTQPMESNIQTQGEILVQSEYSRAFVGVSKHKEILALKNRNWTGFHEQKEQTYHQSATFLLMK